MKVQLGGERLHKGKREKEVYLHDYERSNHDIGRVLRTSAAIGTIIPIFMEPDTKGGTMTLDIEALAQSVPTPLRMLGSLEIDIDFFSVKQRYYNKLWHNNRKGYGLKMDTVLWPGIQLEGIDPIIEEGRINQQQISQSSIHAYLGNRGLGTAAEKGDLVRRTKNAIPYLMMADVVANFYAHKQEGRLAYLTQGQTSEAVIIDRTKVFSTKEGAIANTGTPLSQMEAGKLQIGVNYGIQSTELNTIRIEGQNLTKATQIIIATTDNLSTATGYIGSAEVEGATPGVTNTLYFIDALQFYTDITKDPYGNWIVLGKTDQSFFMRWMLPYGRTSFHVENDLNIDVTTYGNPMTLATDGNGTPEPIIKFMDLECVDEFRDLILGQEKGTRLMLANGEIQSTITPTTGMEWYKDLTGKLGNGYLATGEMQNLFLSCYNNNINNNWLNVEWLDGEGGITDMTTIDTSQGLEMGALIFAKKLFDVANRIVIAGNSIDDWEDATYTEGGYITEGPRYEGGYKCDILFDEVVAMAASDGNPLGQQVSRTSSTGTRGHKIRIASKENMSLILGLMTIRPREGYSQGNHWFGDILNPDEMHKPGLDAISFQDLNAEYAAAWSTKVDQNGVATISSPGKQLAYSEYTTAVDVNYGEFAEGNPLEGMVLDRRYTADPLTGEIEDFTAYIDPKKFNYAFTDKLRGNQPLWIQLGIRCEARRLMQAKQIPTL